jgi:hypothetical protein
MEIGGGDDKHIQIPATKGDKFLANVAKCLQMFYMKINTG